MVVMEREVYIYRCPEHGLYFNAIEDDSVIAKTVNDPEKGRRTIVRHEGCETEMERVEAEWENLASK